MDGVVWPIGVCSNFDASPKLRGTPQSKTLLTFAVGDLVQPGYHDGWIMSNSWLEEGESWSALMEIDQYQQQCRWEAFHQKSYINLGTNSSPNNVKFTCDTDKSTCEVYVHQIFLFFCVVGECAYLCRILFVNQTCYCVKIAWYETLLPQVDTLH